MTTAQLAAAWFAAPFLALTFIWLATCAAYAAYYGEPIDGGNND